MRENYNWNVMYNFIMRVKDEYHNKFLTVEPLIENFELEYPKVSNSINKVLECLQFTQKGDLLLIRYGVAGAQEGMWDNKDSIYREARSLVIDLRTEELVSAPFRKFFNLNEVEENMEELVKEEISNAYMVEYSNKLDGSMQTANLYNGELVYTGSMALDTKKSWRLSEGISMFKSNPLSMSMLKQYPTCTFIFEYISIRDRHVVIYSEKEEGLYLIGIRDKRDGRELSYNLVTKIADRYGFRVPELFNTTLEELISKSHEIQALEQEGFVINIINNDLTCHKVKLKGDDYVKIHRCLDKTSVSSIIEAIAHNRYDDLISKIPVEHRGRINQLAQKIFDYKNGIESEIETWYKKLPSGSRKEVMNFIVKNTSGLVRRFLINKVAYGKYDVMKVDYGNGCIKYFTLREMGIKNLFYEEDNQ